MSDCAGVSAVNVLVYKLRDHGFDAHLRTPQRAEWPTALNELD